MTEQASSVEGLTIPEVMDLSGASARQVHHWIRRGWLQSSRGNGWPHVLAPEEASVARLMVQLISAGLTPQRAAEAARKIRIERRSIQLGPNVWLSYRATGAVVPDELRRRPEPPKEAV